MEKETFIYLGDVPGPLLWNPYIECTSVYLFTSVRWYVPCSIKYPRWSSIFRILSVELWLVLIISIVIAAISTTLVGRYSCTSEWQVYKTLTGFLTNVWAVILGLAVSAMPRTPSLRWLFLAWVCFSLAFSTVFQALLTTFLIDSGYKTPIQNMDELFASCIKLAYPEFYNLFLEQIEGTEFKQVRINHVNCPSFVVCVAWAKYNKNASMLLLDKFAEENYASGYFVGENSAPFLCGLEDGVFYSYGISIVMFNGDPLMRKVNEIIVLVVEADLHTFWNSLSMNWKKLCSWNIAILQPLDRYYSFNLYHIQPAFYILLMS
jgi:hypothetical protein